MSNLLNSDLFIALTSFAICVTIITAGLLGVIHLYDRQNRKITLAFIKWGLWPGREADDR
ncbi:MAG: hypothetical protein A3J65_01465 [Candidatus Buchananbacteria bacterium RIFCSPHIGHO2_02_FULL_45_11b]|uniref:Uncharacterized protein n=2 Tax=Candidatus Buchananiibacteriota TaxID=1817903 RepID=A0A1G1Y959_9BACT|nr:MAG: hypothetical protein A2663_03615 [Candidatus Buchananbacteria bacterium RIFCSPHIGHO2_01_FULL_46_12]OGY52428.1 MAG: hypothetical protein A3J65_01465 [Candidatus Buchananbacteria bacterium RIFCSPHIGHO2_02_FULL_45_11b]